MMHVRIHDKKIVVMWWSCFGRILGTIKTPAQQKTTSLMWKKQASFSRTHPWSKLHKMCIVAVYPLQKCHSQHKIREQDVNTMYENARPHKARRVIPTTWMEMCLWITKSTVPHTPFPTTSQFCLQKCLFWDNQIYILPMNYEIHYSLYDAQELL